MTANPECRLIFFNQAFQPARECEVQRIREEEGEYDIPDRMEDGNYEPDPELFDAVEAHTEEQREAMALFLRA